jgi:predicted outer membrane protein
MASGKKDRSMQFRNSVPAGVLAFCVVAGAALSAPAASAQTAAPATTSIAFIARTTVALNFLEATGRLALQKSTVPRVQEFERGVVRDDVRYANALAAWADAAARTGQIPPVSAGGSAMSSVLTSGLGADAGKLVPSPTGQPVLPVDAEALKTLQPLASPEFDKQLIITQQRAAAEAVSLTESYARSGEDRALRRIAAGALRQLRAQLAILERRV